MNLSFSTRGWNHLTWENWLELAIDMRFAGIEVYNLHLGDDLLERGAPFHKASIAATARKLHELDLRIPCFDTSCDLSSTDPEHREHLLQLMEIAQQRVPAVVAVALSDNEDQAMASLKPCCRLLVKKMSS